MRNTIQVLLLHCLCFAFYSFPFILQVYLIAYDKGSPSEESARSILTVNVRRNNFPPEILNLPAVETIRQDLQPGQGIRRITARDNDTVVCISHSKAATHK